MPRFSPDGSSLVSGQGKGYIYVNNVAVVANAGGWDWLYPLTVAGSGQLDTPQQGFYFYNCTSGEHGIVQVPASASTFYADGNGHWLAYLQARTNPYSFDSFGNAWTDLAALGLSRAGDYIFTDTTNVPLIVRTLSGQWSSYQTPQEWTPLPSGGWFSRNYRGCYWTDGNWYAVGWLAEYQALCVFQPFVSAPIWSLSTDGKDFNSDIATRASDGMLVVGTAKNQGETVQRLYQVDIPHSRFNVNGGPWQALTPASSAPSVTIPKIPPFDHGVRICVFKDDAQQSGAKPFPGPYVEHRDYVHRAQFRADERVCWLADTPDFIAPPDDLLPHDQVWLECYRLKSETLAQSVTRWKNHLTALHLAWPWDLGLVPMFYGQGGPPPDELWTVQEILDAGAAGANLTNGTRVKVITPFAYERANGITAHPELEELFQRLLAAPPSDANFTPIHTPEPEPPEPTPIPPEPTEPPTMAGKYTVIYPGTDLTSGTQVTPSPHPQGGGALVLTRADGEVATIATFTSAPLGFKVANPPGGGEAFYDAGNQYINIDGNGVPHAFLKSGSYGQ